MHDTTKTIISACYQDGSVMVFDKETAQIVSAFPKLHQFEVWYTHISPLDESVIYSCSDDCSFKATDLRSNGVNFSVKKHDAGVTFL